MNAAADGTGNISRTPVWRVAAGCAVLAILVWIGVLLIPVYLHNLALDRLLRSSSLASEDAAKQLILERGRSLGLDISPNQLEIRRLPGTAAVEVRYVVRASLPLYTVDLHFSSTIPEVR